MELSKPGSIAQLFGLTEYSYRSGEKIPRSLNKRYTIYDSDIVIVGPGSLCACPISIPIGVTIFR